MKRSLSRYPGNGCILLFLIPLRAEIGVDTKQQTMSSLTFPMERAVLSALEEFLKKECDYIQLSIGRYLLYFALPICQIFGEKKRGFPKSSHEP